MNAQDPITLYKEKLANVAEEIYEAADNLMLNFCGEPAIIADCISTLEEAKHKLFMIGAEASHALRKSA